MLSVKFAESCAWRGLYVYAKRNTKRYSGEAQIARITFDPSFSYNRPTLSLSFLDWEIRLNIPTVQWKHPCGKIRLFLYKLNKSVLFRLDGRYRKWVW